MKPILFKKIPYDIERFFSVYTHLTQHEEHHVLLESGRTGKYSIAGISPFAIIHGDEKEVIIEQAGAREVQTGKPLAVLENWMSKFAFEPLPGMPDFQGGAIGYISYDYVNCIEKLPQAAQQDLGLPLIYFLIFDEWAVFDHEEKTLWIMVLNNKEDAEERIVEAVEKWQSFASSTELKEKELTTMINREDRLDVSLSEADYMAAVKRVQDYIREGDIFQANLTVRQSRPLSVPPLQVYEELRALNPSPYMGYFHTPAFQLVSGSPELLIQKFGEEVGTRPIAGTRPRGKDEDEDLRLANELIGNEKERAEHIMLVDLERNDIGKVCAYGSVKVDELMVVEKYSHVMHIVSHVSGKLAKGKSAYDLAEAVFPGGTITGAPKIRTMEIIEELEPVKRGIYTGSLGWIGFNKDLHLNIMIRTMLVKDGISHVQAGAGIVIDSDPKAEYEESLKKAEALWRAKEAAENKGDFA